MTKFFQPSDQVHVTGRYGKGVRYRVRPVVATEVELTQAQRQALESYQAVCAGETLAGRQVRHEPERRFLQVRIP